MVTTAQNDGPSLPDNFTMPNYWQRVAAWQECECRTMHQDVAQSLPYIPRILEGQERLIRAFLTYPELWRAKKADRGRPSCPVQTRPEFAEVSLGILLLSWRAWLRAWPCLASEGLSLCPKPPPEESSCLHGKHFTN